MHHSEPPYHRQQILRSLPGWTRHLHRHHVSRLLQRAHREHVQQDGQPTPWFAQACADRQAELRQAIKRRTTSHQALAKALQGLRGITEFCEPLLQARLGIQVALTQAQFRHQPFTSSLGGAFPDPDASHHAPRTPVATEEPAGTASLTSLLEAALHNFEGVADAGPFSALQVSADDSSALPGLSATAFVTHCRLLDLGRRYQEHLQDIYGGQRETLLRALWSQVRRDELTVQALIARMRGHLTDDGLQALQQLCSTDSTPCYRGAPAKVAVLRMLDIQLHNLLLLTSSSQSTPNCIAYLPFDDGQPVQEFNNRLAFGRYLRRRLLEPAYRERFLEHVALKDRPRMASKLRARLFEATAGGASPVETPSPAFGETEPGTHPWQGLPATSSRQEQDSPRPARFPALAIHEVAVDFPVWPKLFNDHVQRLHEDARCIAVPTADIDAKARRERLALWGERGLTLLGVAAMFIPGLDVAMLAVGAGQVMASIFHGFEAWSEGDNAEAVNQVESLLINLGSVAAIAGVAKLANASGFIDGMQSVCLDGKELLWHPQLEQYRSPVELPADLQPDERGIFHHDDRHFLDLDNTRHEIRQDPEGHWRVVHPADTRAYQPRLHGNDSGAWRMAHERPQDWGRVKLMRRLGPLASGLTDEELIALLDSTGLERGVLEQMHVDGKHPPALLEDALRRIKADSPHLDPSAPASAAALTLGRAFPRLPSQALEELAGAANGAERRALNSGRVPLRVAEEARLMQARCRLDRAILGLYRPSLANDDSRLISDSLLAAHPQWTAEQRYHAAVANRPATARLLGQQPVQPGWRSPLRLSEGRYGYPLSPGIFASRAERELHALYPGLNGREIRQLLATLRVRGSATEQIQALRTQLSALREQLHAWATRGVHDWGEEVGAYYTRTADLLVRAWQRLDGDMLSLADVALDALPPLTARFDHITTLSLENLNMIEMPADFLQAFPSLRRVDVRSSPQLSTSSVLQALRNAPQLRELHLSGTHLGELPAVAHEVLPTLQDLRSLEMPHHRLTLTLHDLRMLGGLPLETLDLRANRIALDADTADTFGSMRTLRHLLLSNNPLAISPNLAGLDNLATLRLDNSQLRLWPTGLSGLMQRNPCMLREVDLSMNSIEQVPELPTLLSSPYLGELLARRAQYRWRFNYNPLDEATRESLQIVGASVAQRIEGIDATAPTPRIDWLRNANPQQRATWEALFDAEGNTSLRQVVEQAGMSASARRQPQAFARQVWTLLERASASTRLRTRLDEVAGEFPVSCGDAGADGFGTLQIEVMAYDEAAGMEVTTPPLFQFFRRLFRRDQVNRLAQEVFNARVARRDALRALDAWAARPLAERGVRPLLPELHRVDTLSDDVLHNGLGEGLDLIEIRLALRSGLASRLDFPEPQQAMLYRHTAEISWRTEEAVFEEVDARDEDAEARRQWIARQPGWRRLLRRENSARFAALRKRWDIGMNYLDGNDLDGPLEPPVIEALTQALGRSPLAEDGQPLREAIASDGYVAGMNRMALGLEQDEDALYLRLTRRRDPNS
ncbi:NEL-type E3 ubiquitin ligase domain-containing protein [Pseudomonas sp. CAM1A]|uniref:NEL-type E3 ubiquitin ligase domain-containing protein n=1 Tax=Pseudomonas sp. CAM1A TaxID=3231717 RepID=UPI0039C6A262